MLRFHDRKNNMDDIVILGHIISFEGCPIDMRFPNTLKSLVDEFGDTFEEHLSVIINECLPCETNWGNSEKDYMMASESSDGNLRAMAAIAGYAPEKLYLDPQSTVRGYVVQSFINDRNRGITRDDSLLDAMLSDDSVFVLAKIAEYGKKSHLNTLIENSDYRVLKEVINRGHADHLLKLQDHEDPIVRDFAIQKTLELSISDSSQDNRDILLEIEMQGYDANNLKHKVALDSLSIDGKLEFINEGYALAHFLTDPSSVIREAVAKQGFGVNVLINDPNSNVAFAARCYPSVLELE